MKITEETLQQGMSYNGGWRAKQLKCIVPAHEYIGRSAFPTKGWKFRIIGTNVDKEAIKQFLSLRKKDTREKTGNLFDQRSRVNFHTDTILDEHDESHLNSIRQELKAAIA